jgi:cleavage and polyadenylation specificity factor subunit 1
MEVVSAEFLPFEGQLYILIIDADLDIHVLQYDPERMWRVLPFRKPSC